MKYFEYECMIESVLQKFILHKLIKHCSSDVLIIIITHSIILLSVLERIEASKLFVIIHK